MIFIVVGILVLVYFALPTWLQVAIFIANFFIPDPIPIIDEVLMIVGILNKLEFFNNILKTIVGLLIIGGIIAFIVFFIVPKIGALFAY